MKLALSHLIQSITQLSLLDGLVLKCPPLTQADIPNTHLLCLGKLQLPWLQMSTC